MARKRKPAGGAAKQKAVENYGTKAAGDALGFAIEAARGEAAGADIGRITALTALCDRAADHMALAHNLLVTHEKHTDTAIEHLDAALVCLKQMVLDGDRKAAKPAAGSRKSA